MIYGVGADLCQISRIESAMQRARFVERLCAPSEQARLERLGPARRPEHLAGLFAAKEAVAKALGTGFVSFGFSDIEITRAESGKPGAILHGGAAALMEGKNYAVQLSISHDGGLALAFAVIELLP